jgi:CheY-like chemotaxis protein
MLRRIVREDIKFTTVLAGDIGHIKADRTQITQILLNLAANARDAMPRGGILKIATRKAMLPPNVQTGAIQPPEQRYVLLEVTDTGTGMDEETKARVFEPFFTTKKAVGVGLGTGLGLATVYGIVQQNHGHVCLDSHVGKGTTFSVYLPLADEVIEPERAVPAPAPAEVARATVLLVEDSEQIRKLLCKALESEQYNLLSAADGVEALNVAERHKGPIHLLITDVMLPGIHGPELANQLRTSWPGLRVVYMSGYSDDVLIGAQVKGAFVTKPIELAILRKIVSDTLALTPQSTSEAHAGPTRRAG